MTSDFSACRVVTIHLFLGAVIGAILLHPIAMGVAWGELRSASVITDGLWAFMRSRVETVFTARVLPMTLGYALVGGTIGLVFALYHLALVRQSRMLRSLSNRLADDLPSLLAEGENEHIEFKSSVRWDLQKDVINRSLEGVIAKTIAGLMNHRGGSLVVGVTDKGEVVGLQKDYQTLKHKNRDGFERCIMDIVNKKLGGHKCTLIHCMFHEVAGQDVCRILVEPSRDPVYVNDGQVARYFVRSGNGTRELDAREALAHISQR
jgi:hypothetical protein